MYTSKYQGRFTPKNSSKYRGDINEIIYRSSWELKFAKWCDTNESIVEWGSEIAVIPYVSPIDQKVHRYFVDFYIKVRNKDDKLNQYLIEIKPKRFTAPPKKPKRQSQHYLAEVFQWGVNEAKWKAANEFCNKHGWKFLILTEDDLVT